MDDAHHHDASESTLAIYSDRSFVPSGLTHCLMLVPFWGGVVDHNGFDELIRTGERFLRLVDDPAAADAAVLPFDGRHLIDPRPGQEREPRRLAEAFVDRARDAGLKTIVLVNSDRDTPIDLPDTLVLRTSLNTVTRRPNELVLPAWHEDLLATHYGGELPVRTKRERPVVGFCGHVATGAPPLKRRIKTLAQRIGRPVGWYIPHRDGTYLRREAIRSLDADPRIDTNFLLREQYFGGQLDDPQARADVRRAYLDNIVDSDYTLCVRGYGNFSFRFYEVMSLGRVPLLIDTDTDLPWSDRHDYRRWCVIVPERRLRRVGEHVAAFHDRLSDDGFVELQHEVRAFWQQWLSPEGYFRQVAARWHELAGAADDGGGVEAGPAVSR